MTKMFTTLVVVLFCSCAWGTTAAGTAITNQALLVHRDPSSGIVSQLNSNTVSVKVDAFQDLLLTGNQTVIRPPGSSFALSHTLTNTGNTSTTYAVGVTPVTGSGFVLQTLQAYWDINKDGKIDPGEPLLTPNFTVTLEAGQSTGFVIYVSVPASAIPGASTQVSIRAVTADQKLHAANSDTITVGLAGPALQLTKSADTTAPQPGSPVTFTVMATNNGSSPAAGARLLIDGTAQLLVTLRDQVPANTFFSAITRSTGTTPLYHRRGDEFHSYLSAPPSDLTTVDAVAFAVASVDFGQKVSVAFRVVVAPNASGNISNVALGFGADGTTGWEVRSNVLLLPLPSAPPVIAFYTGDSYGRKASVWSAGLPLYIQADAAQCNLDPLAAETRPITITSTLTNDVEILAAIETGANTGVFRIVPNPLTRDVASNPVVRGNGILEVSRGDTLTAVLQGCGSASVQANILIDPSGLVFDSKTNQPVPNSRVTLIDVTGQGNGGHPGEPAMVLKADAVTAAPSSVVTEADGRFLFPLVAASTYQITVQPPVGFTYPSKFTILQLPSSRFIDFNGSYTRNFTITGAGGTVKFDQPVDRAVNGTTMLEKFVSRSVAQLGEYLDYIVRVKNVSSVSVTKLQVRDSLPRDFIYQLGTTRVNGAVAANPQGGHGPDLEFLLSSVEPNAEVDLTYRVRMGPGARLGKNINYAIATDGTTISNTASATVDVQGGVFSTEGFVVGKVFMDCNENRKQDAGEPGIPGVRVLLEDQTYAITDRDGKYSIYGISPRTHILKLDSETLPAGYAAETLSNRNAGAPLSMFVDLKNGEMFKGDFATGCSELLTTEVGKRIKEIGRRGSDSGAALAGTFSYDTIRRGTSELKAAPSSGIVGTGLTSATPSIAASVSSAPLLAASLTSGPAAGIVATPIQNAIATTLARAEPLEALATKLDGQLGFINLQDGKITPYTQTLIQIEGPIGSEFKLFINDQEVSQKRVGKKVSDPEHHVAAWEFVGVELKPGSNRIKLLQLDQFGNQRGERLISVIAPKNLQKFQIDIPKGAIADGKTAVKVSVHLLDADDVPVTVPVEITLEATEGEWLEKDVDSREPGVQVFVSGGYGEFALRPPSSPRSGTIRLSSGNTQVEGRIDFLPELRPMIATGVVDQVITFRNFSGNTISAVKVGDGFEQELRQLSISNAAGTTQLQSHIGVSLKGKVAGSYLLTLAYDSDKTDQRLFRDIQPDEFYPVYGDSSVRGYDAQSTSRAYLRVDKGKSYILYGDFTTQDTNPARYLSVYNRSVTGAREHFQNDHVNFTAFASHDTSSQQLEELAGNGTSGPYRLKNSNGEVNSEKIDVLVRDRNQPAVILTITSQSRFVDYELEPYTGEILFKSPISSFDANLNPVSIRITYEMNQGGPRFWVSGFDGTVKLSRFIQVGAVYVADLNPSDAFHLTGFNSTIRFDPHTTLTGEFVSTQKDSVGDGDGYHFELQHEGASLKARIYFGRTDKTFDNINALLNQGRGEGGLKLTWKLNSSTRLVGDAIRTEDTNLGGTQVGALFGVERTLPHQAQFELGLRHVQQGQTAASPSTATSTGNQCTSIRSKLTVAIPNLAKLRVYGEYEQDVQDADKKIMAVGGTYQLFERGKLYLRHELISSLGNQLSLTSQQQQAVTVFGIETDYMKNAHFFSEYRERDDFSGRENEAAIGLRNLWPLRPGLKMSTGAESVRVLKGSGATNALALTSSLDYTAHPAWRGTARFEWRGTSNSQSFLNTLGAVVKMSTNWSMLGRNVFNIVNSTSGSTNDQLRNRSQLGFAYRDTATSVWNVLAMVEFRAERDASVTALTSRRFAVFSTNLNYQPAPKLVLSSRYATKFTMDQSGGLDSSSGGDHLIAGRLTYDVAEKWDMGLQTSASFSNGVLVGLGSLQYGIGPEMGRMLAQNLWLSAGYNVFGFRNTDLAGESETNRGAFLRLRYKFDESLFKGRVAR